MPPKPAPLFPPSNAPRTWLLTAAPAPIGLRLARALLDHGDNVVLGVSSGELDQLRRAHPPDAPAPPARGPDADAGGEVRGRVAAFAAFLHGEAVEKGWQERTRVVAMDGRWDAPVFLRCLTGVRGCLGGLRAGALFQLRAAGVELMLVKSRAVSSCGGDGGG